MALDLDRISDFCRIINLYYIISEAMLTKARIQYILQLILFFTHHQRISQPILLNRDMFKEDFIFAHVHSSCSSLFSS